MHKVSKSNETKQRCLNSSSELPTIHCSDKQKHLQDELQSAAPQRERARDSYGVFSRSALALSFALLFHVLS